MKRLILIAVILLLTTTGFAHHLSDNRNPIQYYQLKDEVFIKISPALKCDQTSYYIIDENKSIVGGGTLSPLSNTIILSKFPKGSYTIKLKAKSIIASETFRVS